MDWITGIQRALDYVEEHITEPIDYEEAARRACSSSFHFQRVFSVLCGFTLGEVCDTTVAYLKNPGHDLMSTLKAPDFPTGGELLYDADELSAIYRTGRGSFKVRAKWRYVKDENLIEIYEIPYSTTAEAIMD